MTSHQDDSNSRTEHPISKSQAKSKEELSRIAVDSGLQLWRVDVTTSTIILARTADEACAIADQFLLQILEVESDFSFAANPLRKPADEEQAQKQLLDFNEQFPWTANPSTDQKLKLFDLEDRSAGFKDLPSIGEWIKAGAAKEWLPLQTQG